MHIYAQPFENTQGIEGKGKILTQLSVFWFKLLSDIIPNHLISSSFGEMPSMVQPYASQLSGRSLQVKRLKVLPIEAIVRGYLAGSGWKEYQRNGTVCGIPLPSGMRESDRLPQPLFTPSTKAEIGGHDENIHPDKVVDIVGKELADKIASVSVELYRRASEYALARGIIIADTKFEFGVDASGQLHLIDEVLTPDSSRFWAVDSYAAGRGQDSLDKQFVRDYLISIDFNHTDPVTLPPTVCQKTLEKYCEVFERLTGRKPEL